MNISFYLGSSVPKSKKFKEEIKQICNLLNKHSINLVYGGTDGGLMNTLAKSFKEGSKDNKLIGVINEEFKKYLNLLNDVNIFTNTINERKEKMIELSSLYIVFPGGFGTMEEAFDTISYLSVHKLDRKVIFYNIDNYYDSLKKLINNMKDEGFLYFKDITLFIDNVNELEKAIKKA